jgi:processive 1,2-diacylglycerol beta-glucosyltransferase
MTRILILTASYGDGHNTAAFNLRDALETFDPHVEVEVVDLLRCAYGWVPNVHLTVVAGRNERLRAKVRHATAGHHDRVEVMGWTDALPELMRRAHLVITKAGGATLQECLAAGRPVILSQVVPGQEEGNAELVLSAGMGAVAPGPKAVAHSVEAALAHRGLVYRHWRRAVERHRRPDAAREIARFVLQQCAEAASVPDRGRVRAQRSAAKASLMARARCLAQGVQPLLCDFHTHSNFSDGRLSLAELVDLHGRQGFDVLCVTDHVADPGQWLGCWGERLQLAMDPRKLAGYFGAVERERRRAWNRYGLILLTGLEFNRPALRQRAGSRLLALGLQAPVDPTLPWRQLIPAIHDQGGLVLAPYAQRAAWLECPAPPVTDTSPLAQEAPRGIDAWEIGSLESAFAAANPSPLPLLATGNFHQPKHLRSWKTLLFCERQPELILDCIRRNRHLGLAYFGGLGALVRAPFPRGGCAPPISTAPVASLAETVHAEPPPDLVPAT